MPDVIPTEELDPQEIKDRITTLTKENGWSLENDKSKFAKEIGITVAQIKEIFRKEKYERLLKIAEKISESAMGIDFANMSESDFRKKYSKEKLQLLKMQLAEAEFIRSTLGKDDGYSSRNELTGKNGEDFVVKAIVFSPPVMPKENV